MEWNGRRGMKRSFADQGGPELPRWLRTGSSLDIDNRPENLASYPQYGLTPEMASEFPHLTSAVYPSDAASLYNGIGHPDAGKLVLMNHDPFLVSAPYLPSSALTSGVSGLPPSGSHLLGVNNPLLTHSNGLLPVDDYLTPRNALLHPHQLAPLESHEGQLTRLGEYVPINSVPARDRYVDFPRRSGISRRRSSPPLRRDSVRGRYSPPRVRSPPRLSRTQKRKQKEELKIKKEEPKVKKEELKTKKDAAATSDKRKGAEINKLDATAVETAKDAKSAKTENPTVEKPVAGMIFGCNDSTEKVCRRLQLFGLPSSRKNDVLRVIPGTKLFLFNFNSKELSGVYEAISHGALDIVPNAFQSYGSFPAQVRTKRIMKVANLPLDTFKEAIKENFYTHAKFNYELSASQVDKLVEMFGSTKDKATT
ncbi:hypothetical protein O6H91_17G081300 [Diphasiastrum complanatum]|uniref:Uncharacterized protein n=1 Tax=Diphasiastrum complanatum TaxID=34168 RepID=A0ACC2B8N8_DIPCM|nr:hypothetical protein O6H91_17G081300 [Diphasiastrum complanatum]